MINRYSLIFFLLMKIVCCYNDSYNIHKNQRYLPSKSNNNNPIYYISTGEGLLSHYNQLEKLWNIANSGNKKIVSVPFTSTEHFPDVALVNMCNIFKFPDNLTCSDELQDVIGHKYKCTLVSSGPFHYGLPNDTPESIRDFDYKKIECIAGSIRDEFGTYNPYWHFAHYPLIFQPSYQELLKQVKDALGLYPGVEYAVVHWRRGDQLFKRCYGNERHLSEQQLMLSSNNTNNSNRDLLQQDLSLNCATVEEFIEGVEQSMDRFLSKSPKILFTYLATNEKDKTNLHILHRAHFKLFGDIKAGLIESGILSDNKRLLINNNNNIRNFQRNILEKKENFNSLDSFIIELMLMCDANYFFGWGLSSTNKIVNICRKDNSRYYRTVIQDF